MNLLNFSRVCYCIMFFAFLPINIVRSSPAYPFPIEYLQSDGTKVRVLMKGDEFLNWKESEDGYTLLHNRKGDLEYATVNDSSNLVPSGVMARNIATRSSSDRRLLMRLSKRLPFSKNQIDSAKMLMQKRDQSISSISSMPLINETNGKFSLLRSTQMVPTTGDRKLICILMNFTDVTFHLAQSDFNNLFNQVGYNTDGATGSVKDYFLENSYNQYNLTVDVVGPFTADYAMAYYGNNTNGNVNALMVEAINKANPSVNFADYDNDGNGEVDGVYILFAGKGEESGGPADAIWSNAGSLNLSADGVAVKKYSCSPELRGAEGYNISRIGVICHEFGHVLGAPDFYDTNYAVGGSYSGTGNWDVMAGGTWNNNGATPPHHNPWTKVYKYGWASATLLNSPRTVTLKNAEDYNDSYDKIKTLTEGEFFMTENRAKLKFDSYVPGNGMIIYHIHKDIVGGIGGINATHPMRMYPVAQNATEDPLVAGNYGTINAATCAWPSTEKTEFTDLTTPSSKSWSSQNTNRPIRNILLNGTTKTVSFDFMDPYCSPPITQASGFSSTNVLDDAATISWTRGSGDRVLVLARRNNPVEISPSNGTTYASNSSFMLGDRVDPGTYVVYDGTGTTVSVSDLLGSSTYYFSIFEYNSTDHCYLSPALTGTITTTGCTPCTPTTSDTWAFSITNVSLGTLNNSSGNSVYTSFKDTYTPVSIGSYYNLSVSIEPSGYLTYAKAWIDWNKDCDFQAGEEYDLGSLSATGTLAKQIYIPIGVSIGYCTMRVRIQYNAVPTACGSNRYSETEDYLLKVIRPGTPPSIQASSFTSSNVLDNSATVSWTRGNGDNVLVLMKMGGAVDLNKVNLQTLNANPKFLAGSMVGDNTYVVYNGTGTSVSLTDMLKTKPYYFSILEYNTAENCFLTPALTGSVTTTGCVPAVPNTTSTWIMYLTNVALNSMNNTTGTSVTSTGYSDYTSTIAELIKGTSYPISAKVYPGGTNTVRVIAWIDWNKDCSFLQSDEVYDLGSTTSSETPVTGVITIPAGVTEGFYTMRVRTKFNTAPTPTGDNSYSEAEDYSLHVVAPISNSWNGSTWSNSTPTYLHDVTLVGNYNNAGFACNNLIVNAGKQLTVASGTLSVGKDLTLKSDATGTATLINNGTLTVAGNIGMEQYLPASRNWYMSSPFVSAVAPSGFTYYKYNEVTGAWESVVAGATLTPTVGYIVQASAPSTFVLSGSGSNNLNTGVQSTPTLTRTNSVSKPGFNLVGNPYPSFLNANAAINTNASIDKSLWYRTKNGSNNYVFDVVNTTTGLGTNNNGSGNVTGMIPPLQSFWIRLADGNESATLSFDNTLRLHQTEANLLKTPEEGIRQLLQVRISRNQNWDEAIVYSHSSAVNDLDVFDSPKMSNDEVQIPEIYTFAGTDKVAINGLQNLSLEQTIPLGCKVGTADTFNINLVEKLNFDVRTRIILKDSLLNLEQDITDGTAYSFIADATTCENRFYIQLKSTTDLVGRPTGKQSILVFKNAKNQVVVTRKNFMNTAVIDVVNTVGQKMTHVNMMGASVVIDKPLAPGVYLLILEDSGETITQKFIIK
jgi:M6 family metalloprotease-like protein